MKTPDQGISLYAAVLADRYELSTHNTVLLGSALFVPSRLELAALAAYALCIGEASFGGALLDLGDRMFPEGEE